MFVFVHIPKTAGTTFQWILQNNFGIAHCQAFHIRKPVFNRDDFTFARKIFPWMQSISGGNFSNPWELGIPDPFFMTFLREPVSRVFSHYQNMLRNGHSLSFEETLRSNALLENLHVKMMAGDRNLDRAKAFLEQCGFVGLTEKFDLSLHALDRLCPRKMNLKYRRRQVALDNTTRNRLQNDPRIVEMTREYNKLDLELYSFAVSEIFPKVCAKAGLNPEDKITSFEVSDNPVRPAQFMYRFYNHGVFRQLGKLRACARRFNARPSSP
jgi:hypothetical protein